MPPRKIKQGKGVKDHQGSDIAILNRVAWLEDDFF